MSGVPSNCSNEAARRGQVTPPLKLLGAIDEETPTVQPDLELNNDTDIKAANRLHVYAALLRTKYRPHARTISNHQLSELDSVCGPHGEKFRDLRMNRKTEGGKTWRRFVCFRQVLIISDIRFPCGYLLLTVQQLTLAVISSIYFNCSSQLPLLTSGTDVRKPNVWLHHLRFPSNFSDPVLGISTQLVTHMIRTICLPDSLIAKGKTAPWIQAAAIVRLPERPNTKNIGQCSVLCCGIQSNHEF